jgi:putative phosphoesterase
MLIGLLSDTHIPDHAKELPSQLQEVFRGVDLILHGGDIYNLAVLDELELIAPVLAAAGDDDLFTTTSDRRVKWEHMLTLEGVNIWIKHILWWRPNGANGYTYSAEHQPEKPPDVIIYGHTHEAALYKQNGVTIINPGSPTFPKYKRVLGTVGLLTVSDGKAEAEIIQLK